MVYSMLHETVKIQMPELCLRVCYVILCVERDMKCDEQNVT